MHSVIALVVLLLITSPSLALDAPHAHAWKMELMYLEMKSTPTKYVWGGTSYEGADCSGIIFRSCRTAGIDIQRVTAKDMFEGKGGWVGKLVSRDEAQELDLVWFTWKGKEMTRPFGHVGVFYISTKDGFMGVFQASSTSGHVVVSEYKGILREDTSGIKRLTIGDPK